MEKQFVVYVLQNEEGKTYTGSTSDLEKRIARHNGTLRNKKTSYTHLNKCGEWKLIYQEKYGTRTEAEKREKELKSHQGRKFIQGLAQNLGR